MSGAKNLRPVRQYYVYIMTNATRTLYTGVTNNIYRRVSEHKQAKVPGFTAKYHIKRLVYVEVTDNVESALVREKQIKGWKRDRKVKLIESVNPDWKDLSMDWYEEPQTLRLAQGDIKRDVSA